MFLPILAAPFAFLLFTPNWDLHFYLSFVTCFHSSTSLRALCLSSILPLNGGLLLLEWSHEFPCHHARPCPDLMI